LKPYFTNILGSDICMPLNKHLQLSSFKVATDNLALLTDCHLSKIVPRLFFHWQLPLHGEIFNFNYLGLAEIY